MPPGAVLQPDDAAAEQLQLHVHGHRAPDAGPALGEGLYDGEGGARWRYYIISYVSQGCL